MPLAKLRPVALVVLLALALEGCGPLIVAGGVVGGLRLLSTRSTEVLATDLRIRADINGVLTENLNEIYSTLGAQVFEGRVLLTGTAPTEEDAGLAEELVRGVAGVLVVYNEIQIREPGGPLDYANDVRIAQTIRLKMAEMDETQQAVDSELEVVNGIAYLIGVSPDQETRERVADTIARLDGVKSVVLYLQLPDA